MTRRKKNPPDRHYTGYLNVTENHTVIPAWLIQSWKQSTNLVMCQTFSWPWASHRMLCPAERSSSWWWLQIDCRDTNAFNLPICLSAGQDISQNVASLFQNRYNLWKFNYCLFVWYIIHLIEDIWISGSCGQAKNISLYHLSGWMAASGLATAPLLLVGRKLRQNCVAKLLFWVLMGKLGQAMPKPIIILLYLRFSFHVDWFF